MSFFCRHSKRIDWNRIVYFLLFRHILIRFMTLKRVVGTFSCFCFLLPTISLLCFFVFDFSYHSTINIILYIVFVYFSDEYEHNTDRVTVWNIIYRSIKYSKLFTRNATKYSLRVTGEFKILCFQTIIYIMVYWFIHFSIFRASVMGKTSNFGNSES